MRVLLIEDDLMIGPAIQKGLHAPGWIIDWFKDGPTGSSAALSEYFDLILLDIGLPHCDGFEVLRRIRAHGKTTPVLILTARDAIEDRVKGLDSGADDYLVKPFDIQELSARIRALHRRQHGQVNPLLVYHDLTLDPVSCVVVKAGTDIALSAREFALLETLMRRPGAVYSRRQLEERLYGWDGEVDSNAVEVHIHTLRKKLGSRLIQNIRGLGYLIPKP